MANQAKNIKVYFGNATMCMLLTPDIQGGWSRGAATNIPRYNVEDGSALKGKTADASGMRLNVTATARISDNTKGLLSGQTGFVWIEDSNGGRRVECFPASVTARPISTSAAGNTTFSLNLIQNGPAAVQGAAIVSGSQRAATGKVAYQRVGTTSIKPLTSTSVTATSANPVVSGDQWEAQN